jgi:hypothetical protein
MENGQQKYVLIKHPLKLVGKSYLCGAMFINGVAVLQRGSKAYKILASNPIMKNKRELGLERLLDYGFKSKSIPLLFGKDVYFEFQKAVEAKKAQTVVEALEHVEAPLVEEIPSGPFCVYTKKDGSACTNSVHEYSKTNKYCFGHLRFEKKALEEAEASLMPSSEITAEEE